MELELDEVIENLEYLVSDSCTDTQFDYIEEIEIATKALEKQIPNKVKEYGICPKCNHDFGMEKVNYCPHCGQRLDWRNEHDD
jgi:rRNA maturation endonuclease Nob1|nr:MAG TPA: hypothetical protein [Caudoviricetes sp.]